MLTNQQVLQSEFLYNTILNLTSDFFKKKKDNTYQMYNSFLEKNKQFVFFSKNNKDRTIVLVWSPLIHYYTFSQLASSNT